MGCWGITAFESDAGLDAVCFIREHLPENGNLKLEELIQALQQDNWNAPSEIGSGESHTSPMALAEIMIKFVNHDMEGLDYDGEFAVKDKKFGNITSFEATKESIRWLQDYLVDTLQSAVKNAEKERTWNGWFEKKDWVGWQEHMAALVGRLDGLLASPEDCVELVSVQQPEAGQAMKL